MGEDKIMFAVDWPYADNLTGVNWLKNAPIQSETKNKIFSKNSIDFLKL